MSTTRRKFVAAAAAAPAAAAETGGDAAKPEEILAVFARRQTVRRYKPDPVPDEHLRAILDAARRAPTCMNQQPWKFLVVRSAAAIERMKKRTLERIEKQFQDYAAKNTEEKAADIEEKKARAARFTEGYFTAPVYVVVLVDSESPCAGYALNHDGPLAAGYLMAAARAFGYGTAYLTDGIPDEVTREALAIPARYQRICITPVGIPDGWPRRQPKRKLEEMVAYETLEGHPPSERLPYNP